MFIVLLLRLDSHQQATWQNSKHAKLKPKRSPEKNLEWQEMKPECQINLQPSLRILAFLVALKLIS